VCAAQKTTEGSACRDAHIEWIGFNPGRVLFRDPFDFKIRLARQCMSKAQGQFAVIGNLSVSHIPNPATRHVQSTLNLNVGWASAYEFKHRTSRISSACAQQTTQGGFLRIHGQSFLAKQSEKPIWFTCSCC